MKKTLLWCLALAVCTITLSISSCDDSQDIIEDTSSLPECFFCSSEAGELDFCYEDIYNDVADGGEFNFPFGGAQLESFVLILDLGNVEEQFYDEVAVWLYTALLNIAIQEGYTCFTDAPCECEEGQKKIQICHVPPGNPGNAQTIEVNCNALNAHMDHGDFCGDCASMGLGIEINMDNLTDYLNEQYCILLGNPEGCEEIVALSGN